MAKKMWERLREAEEANKASRQQLQEQGNQQFNNLISKEGEYNTNKHTSTIGDIKKAYKGTSSYDTVKGSLNNYYNQSIWDRVKSIANSNSNNDIWNRMNSNLVQNNAGRIDRNKTALNIAQQNTQNTQQKQIRQASINAYNQMQEDALKKSVFYEWAKKYQGNNIHNKYGLGNIDLYNRPKVVNEDGSISTVRSMSFQDEDGKEVLIPTVVNGKIVSDDEAIKHYYKTGEYLGKFNTVDEANKYAEELHSQQERLYSNTETGESDKRLLEIAKKINNEFQDKAIKDLALKSGAERTAILKQATDGDNNKFRDLNNQVLQYKMLLEAQEKAEKINKDLEDGKVSSAIGHVAQGLPTKAVEAVASPMIATGSLFNVKTPYGTADQDLKDWRTLSSKYDQTTANIDNNLVKGGSAVSGTIGYMVPSILAGIMAPETNIGRAMQGISVGGQSYIENLNNDASNKLQSAITGLGKGTASYAMEGITGGNILGKGSLDDIATKAIASKTSSAISRKLASTVYEVGGETLEELLENQADYLIDKIVNDKGVSLKDWLNEQDETVKNTFASTLVLKMLGLGGNTYNEVQNYEYNAETKKWLNEAQKIINKENLTIDENKLKANNNRQEVTNVLNQLEKENNNKNIQSDLTQEQLNNQAQQITQSKNKTAQNGNMEQIKIDTENFSKQVDAVKNGTFPQRDMLTVGKTPQVLKDIGLPDLPITMTQKHLDTIMNESGKYKNANYHGLGEDIVKQLPEAINNPLDIVSSNTKDDSVVLTTYLADKQDRPVIASIKIDGKGSINDIRIDTNVMTSAYGRNNYDKFMQDNIKNGNLLYDIDRGVIKKVTGARLQLPRRSNSTTINGSSITNSILPTKENVNSDTITNNYAQNNKNDTQLLTEQKANLPSKGETINWNEMERLEDNKKFRKHYQSIIESSNTTPEAKAIAKELMGSDTYVPESNIKQLNEADRRISQNGADNELRVLTSLSDRIDSKITANDIAVGERLIEYYSKIGDKAKLQEAIQSTAMAGTQAGQTVQALSLLNHQTPQGQVTWIQRSVDKMNKELVNKRGDNSQQFNFTPEMMQKILNSENQEQMYKNISEVYQELGQQVSKSRIEQLDSWRYFSMLANPRTHIRNIVGNLAMGKTQSIKNKVAGAIEGTIAQFNPDMERTHTLKPASKEVKQFAKNDIENVADRLELNQDKYNPKSRLEGNMRTFKSDAMENTLGKLFDLNGKALEVEDAWGLKSGYVKALSEYMTANNLNPETITDAQLAKARNYAVEEAKEATFHSQNAIATAINQFSRKNKLTKGITDAVLPFVKTPMNVAKAGMEYNPAGLIKTLTADTAKLRKGDITVNKYIDNLSKGLTGTGIAVLGYAMAEAGILKASGGDDDKKEKYDEALGSQAYSIQIGNTTYSLDWLAPVGIPLFVGAEAHNINKSGKNEKSSISNDDDKKSRQIIDSLENWANAMSNSMSPMSEMSMISGLTSALKSYDQDSTKMLGQMGTNAVKSYVNQYVPTALGQVAKTTDKYERSTTSTKTGVLSKAIDQTKLQVMSKVPGLRQKLPIRTDIWGKEQEQEGGTLTKAIRNGIVPFTVKNVSNSVVDKELNDLYAKTGESSILPTTSLDKTFTIEGQNYRMTNEEYNKYKNNYGKTSYKILENLVKSKSYKSLNNEQKQKAIENVYSYAKEQNKIDYAKNNKLEIKESTLYTTMKSLEKINGGQSSYLDYTARTQGMEKEEDKRNYLASTNYSTTVKKAIYENTIGKDDKLYNTLIKKTNTNINQYLEYKNAKLEADKDSDGKSISGTKKSKVYNYINTNISGYENRLTLLASQYKLSRNEQKALSDYINKTYTSNDEKLEVYKYLSKNFEIKNGKIYYK